MSQNFIKKVENFTCEHCGYEIRGDGYTNHCPQCFWSKHVDEQPGDRAALCQGPMPPAGVELRRGAYRLLHVCLRCGQRKTNRLAAADDLDRLADLV